MISKYLGFDSDYIIIGLCGVLLILFILTIVNIVQMKKLKKNYRIFMSGKDAKTLEDTLIQRLDQVDSLLESNEENDSNIKVLSKNMQRTYQKMGLIKYDAFHEMGGKLSFSLAMLDMRNNGFIINAMHTREGCYTYIKEIIDGNSVIVLSEEEQEALKRAMDPNGNTAGQITCRRRNTGGTGYNKRKRNIDFRWNSVKTGVFGSYFFFGYRYRMY